MDELEELEFDRALAEKRHEELIGALRNIKFPEPKDHSKHFEGLEKVILNLADKIELIKQPKVVTEKTTINQTEVVNSLKEMIKEFKSLKEVLNKKETPKQMEFNVVRNNFGFIQSVIVKQV